MELEEFERVHGILLVSSGLPRSLYAQLHAKLRKETFDGGEFFQIEQVEDEEEQQQQQQTRQRRLVLQQSSLKKESQVFLVDHAWSFRSTDARKQLETVPGLAERMGSLMCVLDESDSSLGNDNVETGGDEAGKCSADSLIRKARQIAEEKGREILWLEFDDLEIDDLELQSLNLSVNFPNLVGLSLWGNKLHHLEVVLEVVRGLKSLRALWLNQTPIDLELKKNAKEAVVRLCPILEIYNSQLTRDYTNWAIGFCGGIYSAENPLEAVSEPFERITYLDLSSRNMQSLKGQVFNPKKLPFLGALNIKGNTLEDDSTESLVHILSALTSLQSLQVDIPGPLGSSAVEIVEKLPKLQILNHLDTGIILKDEKKILDSGLKPRLPTWSQGESLVDRIMRAMWYYIMTYRLADEEKLDETPVWYVMDELGSALRHSDAPNFRVAPFMYLPDGTLNSAISYSLLWPIQDVEEGEECTRDYLVGVGEDQQRSARLTAWFHTPKNYFIETLNARKRRLEKLASSTSAVVEGTPTGSCRPADGRPLAVYSDIPFVLDFLRRPEFRLGLSATLDVCKSCGLLLPALLLMRLFTWKRHIDVTVDEPKEADIIWTSDQIDEDFIKAADIQPHQYINQFPFESCLVMKHHLAQTMQQAYGSPAWLPSTYDMNSQLSELLGDFFQREDGNENNLWIVKPWNMARTIDTTVTSSLQALVRLVETGPKIGQKYIERPALFRGRKFDLRYIVLLRNVQPLEAYLCDVFWARFSNNEYTIDERSLADYETHFTVMNYRGKLNHINTHEFVPDFEKEHNVRWVDVHGRVRSMLRKVFEGAASVHPEMHAPRARAMYGVDVMLDSAFQPNILEVTYCPDCARACKYDVKKVLGDGEMMLGKEFINSVFGNLFLNEEKNIQRL